MADTASARLHRLAERLDQHDMLLSANELRSIATEVRRIERALDEIVADAAEDERARSEAAGQCVIELDDWRSRVMRCVGEQYE